MSDGGTDGMRGSGRSKRPFPHPAQLPERLSEAVSVEERLSEVKRQLMVPHRNGRVVVYRDEMFAAIRALVLEVHEGACWICQRRSNPGGRSVPAPCKARAQLEALGKEGGGCCCKEHLGFCLSCPQHGKLPSGLR